MKIYLYYASTTSTDVLAQVVTCTNSSSHSLLMQGISVKAFFVITGK